MKTLHVKAIPSLFVLSGGGDVSVWSGVCLSEFELSECLLSLEFLLGPTSPCSKSIGSTVLGGKLTRFHLSCLSRFRAWARVNCSVSAPWSSWNEKSIFNINFQFKISNSLQYDIVWTSMTKINNKEGTELDNEPQSYYPGLSTIFFNALKYCWQRSLKVMFLQSPWIFL